MNESSAIAQFAPESVSKWVVTLALFNLFNFHTIVTYNVGYHLDRFDKGVASLENKVVFSLKKYSSQKDLGSQSLSRGGGSYIRDFYYALLDCGTLPADHKGELPFAWVLLIKIKP